MAFRVRTGGGLLILSILAWSPAAWAYRPFDSTDADVAELDHFELEAAPVGYLQTGARRELTLPNLTLNYGVWPDWELVLEGVNLVGLNAAPTAHRDRITDTGLFAKHVLRDGVLQGQGGVSLATEFGLLLPTWHDGGGTVGAWGALIGSYRWANAALHVNAAFELTPEWEPGFVGGVIVEGPERWTVRPAIEALAEVAHGGTRELSGLLGGIWRVEESFSIDLGLRLGHSDEGAIRELRLGFTWSIPVGPRAKAEGPEPPRS